MTHPDQTTELIQAIVTLLTEAYAGPPDPSSTWFIDNEPDSGILGLIKTVNSKEASTSVDGSGKPGTTIASNIEHLRWSMANANAALRGKDYDNNWGVSWEMTSADASRWEQLQNELSKEFEALCQGLKMQKALPGVYLLGVLALVAHAAYHLGTIRQMIERVRAGQQQTNNQGKKTKKDPQNAQKSDLPGDLSQPALQVLMGAGYQKLEQIATLSEGEIKRLHGIGPRAIESLRRALAEKGLSFTEKQA